MRVEVRHGDVNRAMRDLKRMLFEDGIIREVMERRQYEKPSDRRRRKRKEAIRRAKKDQAKRLSDLGLI